ncbi:hypothetical protein HK102_012381 [Quaeritorhiza haematococci]|nr:hypothetical protein HK102_012381 [Quaeritorhiza haematococci]
MAGSAGAHLASMAALTQNDPRFQPGFESVPTTLRACVLFHPIVDPVNTSQTLASGFTQWFAGRICGMNLPPKKEPSPQQQQSADKAPSLFDSIPTVEEETDDKDKSSSATTTNELPTITDDDPYEDIISWLQEYASPLHLLDLRRKEFQDLLQKAAESAPAYTINEGDGTAGSAADTHPAGSGRDDAGDKPKTSGTTPSRPHPKMPDISNLIPPMMVLTGRHDNVVPAGHVRHFVDTICAIPQTRIQYLEFPFAHHGFIMFNNPRTNYALWSVSLFLNETYQKDAVRSKGSKMKSRRRATRHRGVGEDTTNTTTMRHRGSVHSQQRKRHISSQSSGSISSQPSVSSSPQIPAYGYNPATVDLQQQRAYRRRQHQRERTESGRSSTKRDSEVSSSSSLSRLSGVGVGGIGQTGIGIAVGTGAVRGVDGYHSMSETESATMSLQEGEGRNSIVMPDGSREDIGLLAGFGAETLTAAFDENTPQDTISPPPLITPNTTPGSRGLLSDAPPTPSDDAGDFVESEVSDSEYDSEEDYDEDESEDWNGEGDDIDGDDMDGEGGMLPAAYGSDSALPLYEVVEEYAVQKKGEMHLSVGDKVIISMVRIEDGLLKKSTCFRFV